MGSVFNLGSSAGRAFQVKKKCVDGSNCSKNNSGGNKDTCGENSSCGGDVDGIGSVGLVGKDTKAVSIQVIRQQNTKNSNSDQQQQT